MADPAAACRYLLVAMQLLARARTSMPRRRTLTSGFDVVQQSWDAAVAPVSLHPPRAAAA